MLQGISETWIKAMTSSRMAVRSPKILRSGITLCYERYGCEKQKWINETMSIDAMNVPPSFRAASM